MDCGMAAKRSALGHGVYKGNGRFYARLVRSVDGRRVQRSSFGHETAELAREVVRAWLAEEAPRTRRGRGRPRTRYVDILSIHSSSDRFVR